MIRKSSSQNPPQSGANGGRQSPSERLVRRATRKQYSAEEKIRIVLDGLRGEVSIERLTSQRMLEELRLEGYRGSYDSVRRYARNWAEREGERTEEAYVPLSFAPGEAYQFDWSHECVVIREHNIDRSRVYVAGLSAGGAAAAIMGEA